MVILERINQAFSKKENPIELAKYLHKDAIVLLPALTRDEAIKTLCASLVASGLLEQADAFMEAVLEREKIVSTGVGLRVAIPHAKTAFLKDFFIAIGVVQEAGIEWNSLDKKPVQLIFLIGGPDNAQSQYLHILSHLTEIIRDENIRKSIIQAKDTQEVLSYFEGY